MADAELKPLQQIGCDGRLRTVEVTSDPDDLHVRRNALDGVPNAYPRPPVRRNTSASPLDYLFFNRGSIVYWQWVAGMRFRYDYQMTHRGTALVVNFDRLTLSKPHKLTREQRRMLRIKPPTFQPRRVKATKVPPNPMSDNRLDAMARMGRLADEISKTGFYLLEQIVGREFWIKDVAASIDAPQEYVGARFSEALTEAADHYGRLPSSKRKRR